MNNIFLVIIFQVTFFSLIVRSKFQINKRECRGGNLLKRDLLGQPVSSGHQLKVLRGEIHADHRKYRSAVEDNIKGEGT